MIYKKGETNNPVNFIPISLLAMYNIYSDILSARLIYISNKYCWISEEQKGLMASVHGIQDHNVMLENTI